MLESHLEWEIQYSKEVDGGKELGRKEDCERDVGCITVSRYPVSYLAAASLLFRRVRMGIQVNL